MATTVSTTGYATFEDDWFPLEYLADYYTEVQPDERITLDFLVEAAAYIGDVPLLLEFGCGPTVHHLLPFGTRAAEIQVVDYLQRNLDAVRAWVENDDGAWDWSAFAAWILRTENGREPTAWEVRGREWATRERITRLGLADARRSRTLTAGMARFPAVLCCFCPDSITDDIDDWRRCTRNVAALVEPGGWLVLTALGQADSYRVGNRRFPSAGVTDADIADVLDEAGFSRLGTTITTAQVPDADGHGYDSVLLAVSRRR